MNDESYKTREQLVQEIRRLTAKLAAASSDRDSPSAYDPSAPHALGPLPAHQRLELIQAAIDQVHEAVVITESQLEQPGPRIVYVNPAFTTMTGYTAEEVIGRTPRILQGPQTERHVLEELRSRLSQGERFEGQTINYRKDGTPFVLHWHINPLRDAQGHITHWVSIQRDITEQKRMEQLYHQRQAELAHLTRLNTMGEMTSQLAHELNQPLAAVTNYIDGALRRLRADDVESSQLVEALERAGDQARRAGRITRRLRDFASQRDPQCSTLHINELVREALRLLEPELREHRAKVRAGLDDELPAFTGDSVQIEQVVVNLVRNAIDAMRQVPEDQRQLMLRTEQADATIQLTVQDTGPGITDDDTTQLFEPFYTTKPQGMGMGLTISRSIAHAHGGTLHAEAMPQGGIKFILRLPLSGPDGP